MLVAQYSLRSLFAAHIQIGVDDDSVVFFKPQASLNKSAWRVLEAFNHMRSKVYEFWPRILMHYLIVIIDY